MKFCTEAPESSVDASGFVTDEPEEQEDNDWIDMIEQECGSIPTEAQYVNLLQNPERYTGYTGPSARRVWVRSMPFISASAVCIYMFYRWLFRKKTVSEGQMINA